jgi:hypothetical protein
MNFSNICGMVLANNFGWIARKEEEKFRNGYETTRQTRNWADSWFFFDYRPTRSRPSSVQLSSSMLSPSGLPSSPR